MGAVKLSYSPQGVKIIVSVSVSTVGIGEPKVTTKSTLYSPPVKVRSVVCQETIDPLKVTQEGQVVPLE